MSLYQTIFFNLGEQQVEEMKHWAGEKAKEGAEAVSAADDAVATKAVEMKDATVAAAQNAADVVATKAVEVKDATVAAAHNAADVVATKAVEAKDATVAAAQSATTAVQGKLFILIMILST